MRSIIVSLGASNGRIHALLHCEKYAVKSHETFYVACKRTDNNKFLLKLQSNCRIGELSRWLNRALIYNFGQVVISADSEDAYDTMSDMIQVRRKPVEEKYLRPAGSYEAHLDDHHCLMVSSPSMERLECYYTNVENVSGFGQCLRKNRTQ